MKAEQVLVADLVAALLALTLAGLGFQGRLQRCRAFTSYVFAALVTNRLIVWLPDYFYTRSFWMVKETLLAGLLVLTAFDLTARALHRFPRARRFALVLGAVGFGLAAAAALADSADNYAEVVSQMIPQLSAGAAWAFIVLIAIARYYWLPLDRLQRSIALGFSLHLAIYVGLLYLLHLAWDRAYPFAVALDPAVYGASVGLWAVAAWRPSSHEDTALMDLWWETVSPAHGVYLEGVQTDLLERRRLLASTKDDLVEANRKGNTEQAERLIDWVARNAIQVGMESRRLARQLALRKRMLGALGRSR